MSADFCICTSMQVWASAWMQKLSSVPKCKCELQHECKNYRWWQFSTLEPDFTCCYAFPKGLCCGVLRVWILSCHFSSESSAPYSIDIFDWSFEILTFEKPFVKLQQRLARRKSPILTAQTTRPLQIAKNEHFFSVLLKWMCLDRVATYTINPNQEKGHMLIDFFNK